MGNLFTDGRLALIGALQADPAIAGLVKTWFDFGPGLRRRPNVEPAACPALSVAPEEAAEAYVANVERQIPQTLRIEVAAAGQDVAACEELAALVLERVHASNQDCLGLAAQGLTGLRVRAITWAALPKEQAAQVVWTAALHVELLWRVL